MHTVRNTTMRISHFNAIPSNLRMAFLVLIFFICNHFTPSFSKILSGRFSSNARNISSSETPNCSDNFWGITSYVQLPFLLLGGTAIPIFQYPLFILCATLLGPHPSSIAVWLAFNTVYILITSCLFPGIC